MKAKIRTEILDECLSVPCGDNWISDVSIFDARYVNEQGEPDDDGTTVQIYYQNEWQDVVSTDFDFISVREGERAIFI